MILLSSAVFYSILTISKRNSGALLYHRVKRFESKYVMSVLILVKAVCKGYQLAIKVGSSKERVNK